MQICSTLALSLAAGSLTATSLAGGVSNEVVVKPTLIADVSTWRACVPTENTINGSGLSNAALVNTGSLIPAAWPTHVTGGCSNMWHTSCPDQSGSECEGGDTMPYVIFDLGAEWDITGFHLWNHNQVAPGGASETNRGIRDMTVEVSTDGLTFSTPVPFTNVTQGSGLTTYAGEDYALPATAVRYVRIQVQQNWGSPTVTGMSEIRFKGVPDFALASTIVTPNSIELCGPTNVVLSTGVVGVPPGGVVSVTATGDTINPGPLQLLDNGQDGDATAGDGIYSGSVVIPAGYPQGGASFSITASDGLGGTATGSAIVEVGACVPTHVETDDAGELPSTSQAATGNGPLQRIRGTITTGDTDMFRISICSANEFFATAVGGTTFDTQLFLFDLQGMGVAVNDDTPPGFPGAGSLQSTLSGAPADGEYYLAIAPWDRDPLDANLQELFADNPFNDQHGPNGPGGANPVNSWDGVANGSGVYALELIGACFVTDAPPGCPADIGIAGGQPGQDGLLDNNDFIAFITYFFDQNPIADMGMAGGEAGSDTLFDNNDFIAFITHFFDGCPE